MRQLLSVAEGLLDGLGTGTSERAAERIGARLRAAVFGHVLTLSLRWHDRTRSGEVVSRLTTDVGRVLDALVATCTTLLPDLLLLGVAGRRCRPAGDRRHPVARRRAHPPAGHARPAARRDRRPRRAGPTVAFGTPAALISAGDRAPVPAPLFGRR